MLGSIGGFLFLETRIWLFPYIGRPLVECLHFGGSFSVLHTALAPIAWQAQAPTSKQEAASV